MLRTAESAKKMSLLNADAELDELLDRIDNAVYCAASCGKREAEFSLWGLPQNLIYQAKPYIYQKGYWLEKIKTDNPFLKDISYVVKW